MHWRACGLCACSYGGDDIAWYALSGLRAYHLRNADVSLSEWRRGWRVWVEVYAPSMWHFYCITFPDSRSDRKELHRGSKTLL